MIQATLRSLVSVLLVLSLSLAACDGPLAMIAGGALGGTAAPYPDSWAFASDVEEIALETNVGTPRSVTTWSVVSEGSLYVATSLLYGSEEPSSRDWVRAVTENDAVRVRVDGQIFEGRLSRVPSGTERKRVIDRFLEKYDLDPSARSEAAWVYRLSARGAPEID